MRLKSYSAQTHQGPYLQVNEDGYDFDFDNNLYQVLDGFGGSGLGDVAVEKIKNEIKNFYTNISKDPNATMPLYYNPRNLLEANAILNAIFNAHKNLLSSNHQKSFNQRAGASLVLAVLAESILVLVGIGNCCAYHFRQGRLVKVIEENTFKFLSRDKFDSNFLNFPMDAVGMYPELNYQIKEIRIAQGDKVILLTDGVYSRLSDQEIQYFLSKQSPDISQEIGDILKLSNSRGNSDNQTVMILEF